mmetsp:Transcript_103282/g.246000  ORF Transcript_103282/g.246000 Transcript_103282/m.246000 type:complete len:501 (+) Transcript_103282:75-1577(+)
MPSGADTEPLMKASGNLAPATSQDMPSAICTVHAAFWLTVVAGIAVAIVDIVVMKTIWAMIVALCAPLIFVVIFGILVLLPPRCGCIGFSGSLQISLIQHPDYVFTRLTMPIFNFMQGMELCDNAFCQRARASVGKNYVYAGMVSISEWQIVKKTLTSGQARTTYLGAQPLANTPKVDRSVFLLELQNLDKDDNHDGFRDCFYHYMFREGFQERVDSANSKKLWEQLAEDYKTMPHGVGDLFFTENDKGLRGFLIKYFFYVMLDIDANDPEVMKTLVKLMGGDTAIALAYLWPFAGHNQSAIKAVDDLIFGSSVMGKFKEGEEKFKKMTKLELTRLSTCIFRLAAVTGTLQLAKTITGGLSMPPFEDMDKIDVAAEWDKLDLGDDSALENFILEVGRLFPPVSSVHHIATEPFSVTIQGKTVDFPTGTKILVPTNLAMTDKEVWGVDAFKFNPNRPGLQENSMVFANVGPLGSRVCPGMRIAMDTCMGVLSVLGKIRRGS